MLARRSKIELGRAMLNFGISPQSSGERSIPHTRRCDPVTMTTGNII